MSDTKMGPERVDAVKKWALIRFREMLRGAKLTEQIQRWMTGEFGEQYRFSVEIALTEETKTFVENPKNSDKLETERLV